MPAFVDNDAKALALGEGWRGAAIGHDNFIAMVVSTGVGGGIVLDGRLLDGESEESIFGAEYLAYKQRVPRWLPRPPQTPEAGAHDWREAWRSEVSTFMQYAALIVLFVVKQWWELKT